MARDPGFATQLGPDSADGVAISIYIKALHDKFSVGYVGLQYAVQN